MRLFLRMNSSSAVNSSGGKDRAEAISGGTSLFQRLARVPNPASHVSKLVTAVRSSDSDLQDPGARAADQLS
jgi:hypothetical protein